MITILQNNINLYEIQTYKNISIFKLQYIHS